MARAKLHFRDKDGAICRTKGAYCNRYSTAPLHERIGDVKAVTCLKCARKLREWGFALQSFSDAVKQAL